VLKAYSSLDHRQALPTHQEMTIQILLRHPPPQLGRFRHHHSVTPFLRLRLSLLLNLLDLAHQEMKIHLPLRHWIRQLGQSRQAGLDLLPQPTLLPKLNHLNLSCYRRHLHQVPHLAQLISELVLAHQLSYPILYRHHRILKFNLRLRPHYLGVERGPGPGLGLRLDNQPVPPPQLLLQTLPQAQRQQ